MPDLPYGQTDVMHDRRWLLANLAGRGPHDPLRHQMEMALQNLDTENVENSRRELQSERLSAQEQARLENDLTRRDAMQMAHDDRTSRAKELAEARQMEMQQHQNNALLEAARTTTDPADSKALMDEWKRRNNIQLPAQAAAAGGVHPSVAKFAESQGAKKAPETAPASTGLAPSSLAQPLEAPPVGPPGTAQANRINQLKGAGQPYVEGGLVFGGPSGQDFNTNTGDFVPSSREGTFNSRPIGEAIAAGARKTGISPESPRGIAAVEQDRAANLAAGVTRTPNPQPGEWETGVGHIGTAPANVASEPVGILFHPSSFVTPQPAVAGQPNPSPNPTPTGPPPLGPFTGAFPGPITQAPTPTPAGTPPATPPPQRVLTDEEKRRQQTAGI